MPHARTTGRCSKGIVYAIVTSQRSIERARACEEWQLQSRRMHVRAAAGPGRQACMHACMHAATARMQLHSARRGGKKNPYFHDLGSFTAAVHGQMRREVQRARPGRTAHANSHSTYFSVFEQTPFRPTGSERGAKRWLYCRAGPSVVVNALFVRVTKMQFCAVLQQ